MSWPLKGRGAEYRRIGEYAFVHRSIPGKVTRAGEVVDAIGSLPPGAQVLPAPLSSLAASRVARHRGDASAAAVHLTKSHENGLGGATRGCTNWLPCASGPMRQGQPARTSLRSSESPRSLALVWPASFETKLGVCSIRTQPHLRRLPTRPRSTAHRYLQPKPPLRRIRSTDPSAGPTCSSMSSKVSRYRRIGSRR